MALESAGTILYVAKISYQSRNWYGNCWGDQNFTQTHRHTHCHTHRPAAQFISLFFLRKCRNKTKNKRTLSQEMMEMLSFCINTSMASSEEIYIHTHWLSFRNSVNFCPDNFF